MVPSPSKYVDEALGLFYLLREIPDILRILSGLGQNDPLKLDQRLWCYFLLPPMVISAINKSDMVVSPPEIVYNAKLSLDPDEISSIKVSAVLRDIKVLRWSDGTETIARIIGNRTEFATRYEATQKSLELMQSILEFALAFSEERVSVSSNQ